MVGTSNMPSWVYKLMLVLTTVIWGLSYTVMKDVMDVVEPGLLVGVRCTLSGVLLMALLWRRMRALCTRRALWCGIALGVFDFAGSYLQTLGLTRTTPGISAFLTATYCVIVPFAWWFVARRKPTAFNIAAALLALVGIWLVSVNAAGETLSMGFGEALTLVAAFMFALHMVFVSKFSRNHDVFVLTALQFLVEGALGFIVGACVETPPAAAELTALVVVQLVFLTLLCTLACFAMQNVSLAHVPPTQASLLLSLESVFGVLFSLLLFGERLSARLLVGFALIFAAVLVSEAPPPKRRTASGG